MEYEKSKIKRTLKTSQLLRATQAVAQYDDTEHDEAEAVAHAVWDLDESFRKLTGEIFPKLEKSPLSKAQIQDILWEIRDELRHITYHINDCRSFKD
jgi:hypothetical protein